MNAKLTARSRLVPFSLLVAASLLLVCASAALGTTYYVDSVSGKDIYDGISPSSPWRTLDKVNATTFAPGDVILFRIASTWHGQLWPKGSGVEGNPIIIDVYHGPGDIASEPHEPAFEWSKPVIHGDGETQEAFRLYNQEYWEVHNLEVTNYDPEGPSVNPIRQGVRVLGEDAGTLDHIYLRWLWVHAVNGSFTEGKDEGRCNAGILLDVEGDIVPTNFNDVLIERCTVYASDRAGIATWSSWGGSVSSERTPHTGVVLTDNWIHDIGGEAVVLSATDAPLVEENHFAGPGQRAPGEMAGIRIWDTNDALLQHNELHSAVDGPAFDIDGMSRRTIIQYNYSQDNGGGFVLLREVGDPGGSFFNEDAIVRYNISQNDGDAVVRLDGKVTGASIYNNTVYIGPMAGDPDVCRHTASGSISPEGIQYHNNIFYNLGGGEYDLGASSSTFDYNLFYGNHPASEPADAHKLTSDPRLLNPGTGADGRPTADGYMPRSDSPCVDSGATMPASGGEDFYGKAVPYGSKPDRGAFEYSGQAGTLVTLTVLADVAGLPIQVSPADTNGDADGLADFTRVYEWGTVVTLTSPSYYDEWVWFCWSIHGSSQWGSGTTWTITMGADRTVLAWYEHQAFPDVPPGYWAYDEIEACYYAGITSGYEDGLFHPDWHVGRDQMAVFLIRALGEEPVPPNDPQSWKDAYGYDTAEPTTWEVDFTDVPATGWGDEGGPHWAWFHIQRLYALGVTKGISDTHYGPTIEVSRDQMGVFLIRALGLECADPCEDATCWPYDPAEPSTWAHEFGDVPATGQPTCHGAHWAWFHIQALYETEVTLGCGDGSNYCPAVPVRRDEMAAFLARAFLGM